jgi:hypothetical protein
VLCAKRFSHIEWKDAARYHYVVARKGESANRITATKVKALIPAQAGGLLTKQRFFTHEEIPEEGVYYVYHAAHRLIRSIVLRKGDRFPRCSQCSDQVSFELMLPASTSHQYEPVHIFELPLEETYEDADAATAE